MTPDRKEELQKTIKKGSEISPERARCSRCLTMFQTGELYEGHCERCTQALKEEVSQGKLRELVFERDKGICAECDRDTIAIQKELAELRAIGGLDNMRRFSVRVHFFVRCGFPKSALEGGETLWQCDHKVERVAGGASTPEQCQTLCLVCHRAKTSGFASKRADARKSRRSFGR